MHEMPKLFISYMTYNILYLHDHNDKHNIYMNNCDL